MVRIIEALPGRSESREATPAMALPLAAEGAAEATTAAPIAAAGAADRMARRPMEEGTFMQRLLGG
ncbi:hypothetical protein NSZ01_36030 [Nocardioides szechwanensis]|nr:hypothetical protein NSZ01_36030 [Nocardioides szechwanensis]